MSTVDDPPDGHGDYCCPVTPVVRNGLHVRLIVVHGFTRPSDITHIVERIDSGFDVGFIDSFILVTAAAFRILIASFLRIVFGSKPARLTPTLLLIVSIVIAVAAAAAACYSSSCAAA